jgi:hypothetical protein
MSGKIFFVEDDKNFGAVMKSYLEMNGFIVEWTIDGNEALKKFKYGVYDLCIIDDIFNIESKIVETSMPFFFTPFLIPLKNFSKRSGTPIIIVAFAACISSRSSFARSFRA